MPCVVQVVTHQLHPAGVRIILIQKCAHFLGPIHSRSAVAGGGAPPTADRIKEHENRLHPTSFVVIILPNWLADLHGQRRHFIPQQLLGRLVHADQRLLWRVLHFVQIEDVFHLRDEACPIALGNAPTLLSPRLKLVFLSVLRTVSVEIRVTIRRWTSSSASNWSVQRVRPSGAALQQIATRWASPRPSSLGKVGGVARTLRCSAGASPSCTKRRRMRSMVFTCMPNASPPCARVILPPGRL